MADQMFKEVRRDRAPPPIASALLEQDQDPEAERGINAQKPHRA